MMRFQSLMRMTGLLILACMVGTVGNLGRADDRPITSEERSHWAFHAIARPRVPVVRDQGWVRNPVDAFILARLEAAGLRPSQEADRGTLIRRLSFDLTGMPPDPNDVEQFVRDPSADAYEKVVDRFLSSPQYGVRWAQHWLDLARYADTDGYEFDQARPNAWRYRDWAVSSLNRDLPYDRFITLQLAGDEVAPNDPDAFVATGFNRCYPDMVDLNDQGLRRQNALNDITETTGLVFLGLTIGCARCHDHKFDPVRQTDFYRLQAFFTPLRFRDDYVVASKAQRETHERAMNAWEAEVSRVQAAILRIEKPVRDRLAPGLPMGALDEAVTAYHKAEAERSPAETALLYQLLRHDGRVKAQQWPGLLSKEELANRQEFLTRLDQLSRFAPPSMPTARGADEPGREPPPTFLLKRGEFGSRGPAVEPSPPSVFGVENLKIEKTGTSSGRRTALANWLTSAEHPLTARVMVNRVWQRHFGRGLVGTASDFGVVGEAPSHPELLDWLASEFIARGWSVKSLIRLIVTSAAYRQSSRHNSESRTDQENQLLGRQNRRRLDGEAIRDALLATSGRLDTRFGGPGVFPPLPPELTRLSSKGQIWPVSPRLADHYRRSLYIFIRRNLRYPLFEVFDRPDTNASCPQRPVTTIAPQALSLLNSPLASEAAQALALRVAREVGASIPAQIDRAYLLTVARNPDGKERALAREFMEAGQSLADLCLALINLNEFIYID